MSETMNTINVGLGDRSYPIKVGANAVDSIGDTATDAGFASPVAIITDDTVAPLYAEKVQSSLQHAGFESCTITIPSGEPYKNLNTLSTIYDEMVDQRIERTSGVIALGGGVVGDMGGYAAASYMRGIPFIQVPTTLLAQVDAAVGGKVGIDHKKGKNLIGAFYQPKAVIIDTLTLKTLPERQIRAGLAEVIKHGIIRDRELFDYVSKSLDNIFAVDQVTFQKLIPWNCQIKASVVEQDEREGGLRAILNFGHTIGHAIEAVAGYDVYLHGEAIAIGMLAEAQLGAKLGITPNDAVDEIHEIFKKANYPLAKPDISSDDLINSMYMDKKVSKGTLRFALPTKIGDTVIHPLHNQASIREVWDAYAE